MSWLLDSLDLAFGAEAKSPESLQSVEVWARRDGIEPEGATGTTDPSEAVQLRMVLGEGAPEDGSCPIEPACHG